MAKLFLECAGRAGSYLAVRGHAMLRLVMTTRTESDTFGPIEVPAERLWGAQTQRSLQNFRIGGERMPIPLVHALALVKQAAALVNKDLGGLEARVADAIAEAAAEVV